MNYSREHRSCGTCDFAVFGICCPPERAGGKVCSRGGIIECQRFNCSYPVLSTSAYPYFTPSSIFAAMCLFMFSPLFWLTHLAASESSTSQTAAPPRPASVKNTYLSSPT
ncbi:hypothetical protein PILCRDRAFT_823832, partial [Piloderma croceum F 1598]